ncbi:MAG: HlyD family efflux transporter periplasmic adaptor subunit [Bacteroidales bacterium]|nr:HlyD family efflux transporter periplasmic adaptor subunit [Bacteroidales bacterium]
MDKKDFSDINVRSQASREIMGYIPHWIIRAGIAVIFVVIVLLLCGTWFFKYPDLIRTSIVLTAENPPASIIARSNGKLEALLVDDKQKVTKGQWLGVIENTANYQDVIRLKNNLTIFEKSLNKGFIIPFDSINKRLSLGEIQTAYFAFINAGNDLQIFNDLEYFSEKINMLNKELSLHSSYYNRQKNQKEILEQDLQLCRDDYLRDSVLLSKRSISKTEFERRFSAYLQKQFDFENFLQELSKEKIQMLQIEQKLLDIKLNFEEKGRGVRIKILETTEKLFSMIEAWEQKFVLKTPVDGIITFSNIWNVNHNVSTGEKVMTVVPETPSTMIGRMLLPLKGSGKVKPGLEVNIKFSNFPPSEYGIVKGKIDEISLVPEDNHYFVEVSLPEGLMTTYGKTLEFHPEMQGDAEIITEDVSLLMRIMRPLKALFKNN